MAAVVQPLESFDFTVPVTSGSAARVCGMLAGNGCAIASLRLTGSRSMIGFAAFGADSDARSTAMGRETLRADDGATLP